MDGKVFFRLKSDLGKCLQNNLSWVDLKNIKCAVFLSTVFQVLPRLQKKKPVDFDDELKIGDVRYDNMTKITIKVQLFWRLPCSYAQKWTVYE